MIISSQGNQQQVREYVDDHVGWICLRRVKLILKRSFDDLIISVVGHLEYVNRSYLFIYLFVVIFFQGSL